MRQTTTATYAAVVQAIRSHLGVEPDSALLDAMIAECHLRAEESTGEPATDEELIYFARSKARALASSSNIRNHLAVMRRAMPECFSGEAFRVFREAERQRRSVEDETGAAQAGLGEAETDAENERWTAVCERHRSARGYDMLAIAEDADMDEKGRRIAREMARRLGRFTAVGLVV